MRRLVLIALLLPALASAQEAPETPAGPPTPEGCLSQPVGVDGLYEAMELAKMSLSTGDTQTFLDALTYTTSVMPCLSEPMPRRMAAEIHRLLGLRALAQEDTELAAQAFAAARKLEPIYTFPPGLVPDSLPVADHYETFDLATGAFEAIPEGTIELDGRPADERPTSWPTLAQVFDETGAVRSTTWVKPGDPLPEYTVVEERTVSELPAGPVARGPIQPSRPLVAATGAAALVGATTFLFAHTTRAKWADEATPYADLEKLEGRTNALTTLSVISGVATLGLGVSVVATW